MPEAPRALLSLDTKVVLLGLATALLTAGGLFFQKLNGVRGGNLYVSVWLVLALACLVPNFFVANKVFLMGGRMSLYVPVTAASYLLSMLAGRLCFGEAISTTRWLGGVLVMVGVAAIARG